jgi:hypothetical protein
MDGGVTSAVILGERSEIRDPVITALEFELERNGGVYWVPPRAMLRIAWPG